MVFCPVVIWYTKGMSWLAFVLSGHLANAGAFLIDKILLSKRLQHPTVYVFFIGVLSAFAFLLLPIANFRPISGQLLIESALAGSTFIVALLCFFEALRRGETSTVVPLIGALVPIWTIGFAQVYLGEGLSASQGYGIVLLIIGAILVSYEDRRGSSMTVTEIVLAAASGGFFAVSYTLTKAVFNGTEFLNGFLWMRLFALLTALPLLLIVTTRRAIFSGQASQRPGLLFLFGQVLGAAGFFLLNLGLKYAPQVSVVNALQGIQYGFLFLFILGFSFFAPNIIHEHLTKRDIIRKIIAIIILGVGLMLAAV